MNPLIISPETGRRIKELIAFAEKNIYTYEDLLEISKHPETLQNDFNLKFTMRIPYEYNVTYTHEYHKKDVVCRHMSVSVDQPDKMPHPIAVKQIMKEFGFINESRG